MRTRNVRSWMLGEALTLLEQAERLQRQFFHVGSMAASAQVWEPPIDVVETSRDIRILMALPGVAPEAVAVCAEPGVVTVTALRAFPDAFPDSEGARIHRVEIPYGRFERRIPIPLEVELSERSLSRGVLRLVLTKRFEATGKEAA